jgi:hypothetical protein
MSDEHYSITFRRALVDEKLREWLELIGKINNVTLDNGRDMLKWDLNTYGTFSVQSMYLHLLNQHAPSGTCLFGNLKFLSRLRFSYGIYKEGLFLQKII